MVTTWEGLFALAREIDEALSAERAVDPDAAQRLARAVLELAETLEPGYPPE